MRNAIRIFVFHFCSVRPALRPIGTHRHKGAGRNLPMIFLPSLHSIEREGVIGILRRFLMHVDNDQRQNHFFWVDLINGAEAFDKMRRWINVSAPLADVREEFCEETSSHYVRTLVRHGGSVLWRIV